ncbi:bifunctional nuclease family protein [Aduncisulcus paluster]|uniref:Bifunctional nuclease family protein n=1 Tax=Aduncisulcus paluster TaxID=2918883 RepID=A0ABQ5KDX8_9EUKA|nr:bifunctional nuclease family protein [Aduncisulcus paluster]
MEAMAISMVLNEVSFPRPMTHDLLLSTIATFGGELVSVDIVDIEKGTFYAEIMVRKDGELPKVIDVAGTRDIQEKVEEKSGWEDDLEGLSPDDFKYKM